MILGCKKDIEELAHKESKNSKIKKREIREVANKEEEKRIEMRPREKGRMRILKKKLR